jgi:hypothetical protein
MKVQLTLMGSSFNLMAEGKDFAARELDVRVAREFEAFTHRYQLLLGDVNNGEGLIALGQDLYRWLNEEDGQFTRVVNRARPPLHFEISTTSRQPSETEWVVLGALGSCSRIAVDTSPSIRACNSVRHGDSAPPRRSDDAAVTAWV